MNYRFVIPALWPGGGPRNVYTLSGTLKKKGYDSSIIAYTDLTKVPSKIGGAKSNPDLCGAKVRFLGKPLGLINQAMLKAEAKSQFLIPTQLLTSTLSVLPFEEPACYVATAWQSALPTLKLAQLQRKPALYYTQAYETTFGTGAIHKSFANKTYLYPLIRFTQSAWLGRFLDSNYSGKTYHLGMGINHAAFRPTMNLEYKPRIVTVARWDVNKGFDVFVEAIRQLRKMREDFEVIIIGEKLALDMQSQNLDFPYKFAGWIRNDKELASYYQNSIFVNTGIHEALPMPPIEAMASGATIVMTDMEGAKEYTRDRQNCLLAPIRNAKTLAKCLDEVLSSEGLREQLVKNAILTAERYSWDVVADKFKEMVKKEGIE